MIKNIEITNFKGIKDTVSIDLKPITLLFGPNSAGKSTIIQAMHFLKEILERKNYSPRQTAYGGRAMDLGGFLNLVHGHDKDKTVTISIELDLSENDLPSAQEEAENEKTNLFSYSRFSGESFNGILTFDLRWIKQLNRVEVTKYELFVNNHEFATILLDYQNPKNVHAYFDDINIQHPIQIDAYNDGTLFTGVVGQEIENFRIEIENPKSVIPNWQNGIKIRDKFYSVDKIADWFGEDREAEDVIHNYKSMMELVCKVMWGYGKLLLNELEKFRYIGPMREIPSRNFDPHFSGEIERWADGLAAWDLIYTKNVNFDNINKWLSHLKINYELQNEEYFYLSNEQLTTLSEDIKHILVDTIDNKAQESDLDLPLLKEGFTYEINRAIADSVDKIFKNIKNNKDTPKKNEIYIKDKKTEIRLKPYDIGVGISQILPVIVGVLNQVDSILAIEQPELHLHPAIQVELADLFINQINMKPDVVYLVETHSEHFMLRFLRRIEERYKNKIKDKELLIEHENINVFVIEDSVPFKGYSLPIDETGEFEKEWPNGFFEEREEELFPDD